MGHSKWLIEQFDCWKTKTDTHTSSICTKTFYCWYDSVRNVLICRLLSHPMTLLHLQVQLHRHASQCVRMLELAYALHREKNGRFSIFSGRLSHLIQRNQRDHESPTTLHIEYDIRTRGWMSTKSTSMHFHITCRVSFGEKAANHTRTRN